MTWLVVCRDVEESAALRRDHLQSHLAYIEQVMDRISVAGPLVADAGDAMNGSCFIYRTDDPDEARALLHDDPYYRAGVYGRVEFLAFKPVAGVWLDGASWKKESSAKDRG